ncbi:MAG TPA: hypothetical protein VMV94_05400, partial [Phycisphaerae bacterium]|nr:hypothetical protein [Phycisphaerae bacterium]
MASKKQIEANRRNWQMRRGLTPTGRERLRLAALRSHPWEHATGPRTEAGRRRSRANAVFFGDFCKTVEPLATANQAARAEGVWGSAVAVLTVLAHERLPNEIPEQETWYLRFLAAVEAVELAQRERQAAWRRFAVTLGLPEPTESAADGFDWCGYVLAHSQVLPDVDHRMALAQVCLAAARAGFRGAFGLWPNLQAIRN